MSEDEPHFSFPRNINSESIRFSIFDRIKLAYSRNFDSNDEKLKKAKETNEKGLYYQGDEEYVCALYLYILAVNIKDDYSIGYSNAALMYGDYLNLIDKAIEYYLLAIKHDPETRFAYNGLGLCYHKKGDWLNDINYYELACKKNDLRRIPLKLIY
jgi:tetratricopeptide (TPR) repeat protein